MEMTRQTMAQENEQGRQDAKAESRENNPEPDDGSVDQVLSAGLKKLYDPILDEQVPAEMLEILKRKRKR